MDPAFDDTLRANTYETTNGHSQPSDNPNRPVELFRNGKDAATSDDIEGTAEEFSEESEATNVKIDPTLDETQSANTSEYPDPSSQPSDNPASRDINEKNVATGDDSDDKLNVAPNIEVGVEGEQRHPSRVDSLVQQLPQVSVSDDLTPTATNVEELELQMSQVPQRGVVPPSYASLQRGPTKMLSAAPSSPTSRPPWADHLTSELDVKYVVDRSMSSRTINALTVIPTSISVIVERNGVSQMDTNIHDRKAFIAPLLNEFNI
ncbi:hypothetical protein HDU81_003534 [Chytriomyces hyalinus]|nr:hypothetical protein HDU81_003534 [Chytriomyces hyalinus]